MQKLKQLPKFKWNMSKAVQFSQNVCKTDAVSDIICITELDYLSNEEFIL